MATWLEPCPDCGITLKIQTQRRQAHTHRRELEGGEHICPVTSPERVPKDVLEYEPCFADERLVLSGIQKIAEINTRLQTCHLQIVRVDHE